MIGVFARSCIKYDREFFREAFKIDPVMKEIIHNAFRLAVIDGEIEKFINQVELLSKVF